MELKRGMVVRSAAGHDRDTFCAILSIDGSFAFLCDGKRRPLEKPKKKKRIHFFPTGTVLSEEMLKTNRSIRTALRKFQSAGSSKEEA